MQETKETKKTNYGKPSPFRPLFGVSIARTSTLPDWNRVGRGESHVTINGKSVQELLPQQDDSTDLLFANDKELRAFWTKNLLVAVTNDPKRANAVDKILPRIMHQGFTLNLMGGAANFALAPYGITAPDKDTSASNQGATNILRKSEVRFTSTRTGFEIIDVTTQRKCKQGVKTIEPDSGKEYIYRARVVIQVDLVSDPSENPIFIVQSNTVDYGNKQIERLLGPKNFLHKLVAYLKSMFGQERVTINIPPDTRTNTFPPKREADKTPAIHPTDEVSPQSKPAVASLPNDQENESPESPRSFSR